jgi:hypothetical protein
MNNKMYFSFTSKEKKKKKEKRKKKENKASSVLDVIKTCSSGKPVRKW